MRPVRSHELYIPDAIQARVMASYHRRMVVQDALGRNGTTWHVQPRCDPTRDSMRKYLP